ncbi:hypothetical protein M422DRAFT_268224 [Sphaerobolus stellatus SS14]|uniref:Uncharacterized protein n=1 Tax=Sphaerobolus stellatus (strain SS14) TaxID=990650 RepID=A0A0C9UXZ7_SPHS4|nr:hypothetical protein M422DRAFT_268224 [Sphaerobolus stellatus SS14]
MSVLYAHATRWSTTRAPSSNPSLPASIRASPQQLQPIRLRLLRSRTTNVTLLTGRKDDIPAASLVHNQDVSQHIDANISIIVVEAVISGDTYHHHFASHSSFPSPSSCFVPPPMPAKHEYAGVGRASAPALNGAGKKEMEGINVGVAAKMKADAATVTAGLAVAESAATPITPTPSAVLHARFHSHAEQPVTPTSALTPNSSPPEPINTTSAKHSSFSSSRSAPVSPPASIAPAIPPLQTPFPALPIAPIPPEFSPQLIPFLQTVFSPLYLRLRLRFNIHIWQEIRRKPHHPNPTRIKPWHNPYPRLRLPHPRLAAHNVRARHAQALPQNPKKIRASLPSVLVPKIASSCVDFVGG